MTRALIKQRLQIWSFHRNGEFGTARIVRGSPGFLTSWSGLQIGSESARRGGDPGLLLHMWGRRLEEHVRMSSVSVSNTPAECIDLTR